MGKYLKKKDESKEIEDNDSKTQNHEKVIDKFMNMKIKCIKGNQAPYVCQQKSCDEIAFMCEQQKCQCYKNHQKCGIAVYKSLIRSLKNKILPAESIEKKINQFFQKAFSELSSYKEDIIQKIYSQNNLVGLTKKQHKFLQFLQDDPINKITGDIIMKTFFDQIQSKQNLKKIIQQKIQNEYQTLSTYIYQFQTKINDLLFKIPDFKQKLSKWNSKIITNFQKFAVLQNFFSKQIKSANLLYRASENNFETFQFYEKCSYKPNTLIIVETKFGKIIGGYTPFSWRLCSEGYIHDQRGQSFIFSLTNNHKFYYNKNGKAIYRREKSQYGPCFGGGYDLYICDKANENNYSQSRINYSYQNNNYQKGDKYSYQRFNGNQSQHFKVKEWQVYQLFF